MIDPPPQKISFKFSRLRRIAAETIDKTGAIMLASTPFHGWLLSSAARSFKVTPPIFVAFPGEGEFASREIRLVKE